jgi:hypothetical protein
MQAEVDFYDLLASLTERACELIKSSADMASPFVDRNHDYSLEESQVEGCTLFLRYKRLPSQGNCPPLLESTVEALTPSVQDMVLNVFLSPGDVNIAIQGLVAQLAEDVRSALPDLLKHEDRWQAVGLSQWVRYDPAIRRIVARFLCRALSPQWSPLSTHEWRGFATLFDFNPPLRPDEQNATSEALDRLVRDAASCVDDKGMLLMGSKRQPMSETFEPRNMLFERWPAIFGWGVLWTEYPENSARFYEAWDKSSPIDNIQSWKKRNPKMEPLIRLSREVSRLEEDEDTNE